MLDNFTQSKIPNIAIFKTATRLNDGSGLLQPIGWTRPDNVSIINFFVVGAGGAGGAGFSATGTARGGGGGGGSGAIVRVSIPAIFLPTSMYVFIGTGGSTTSGGFSGISLTPSGGSAASYLIISPGGDPGDAGASSGAAAGGAGGGIANVNQSPLMSVGNYTVISGLTGASGGSAAGINGGAGGSKTALTSQIIVGGSGGGGGGTVGSSAGGAQTGDGIVPTIAGGAVAGGNGSMGYQIMTPFCSQGGSGGAGALAGVGGIGGSAGYGSGGGGGGGGTTGGIGGRGGDGLVIITWN